MESLDLTSIYATIGGVLGEQQEPEVQAETPVAIQLRDKGKQGIPHPRREHDIGIQRMCACRDCGWREAEG